MKASVRLEGGRDLEAALAKLGTLYRRKKAARDALREVAEPIRDAGEANAPVRAAGKDKRYRTRSGESRVRRRGALKMHVNMGTRLSKRQAMLARKLGKDQVEVYVGTRDRIGRLVEMGTRHSAANPFLRKAWRAKGGTVALETLRIVLWKQIERQTMLAARAAKRKASKMGKG